MELLFARDVHRSDDPDPDNEVAEAAAAAANIVKANFDAPPDGALAAELLRVDNTAMHPVTGAPPLRTLVAISAIGAAVEFTWSSGEVVIEPFLLQFWPASTASFVFLANPAISLWLQLLLGQASDRCTSRFGRRRPFIIGLTITGLVGLTILFFSCAQPHAHPLGHSVTGTIWFTSADACSWQILAWPSPEWQ